MCAIPALSKVSIQRSTRLKSYCTAPPASCALASVRSEEHTSELQSQSNLVCRLLLEKKNSLLDAHRLRRQRLSYTARLRLSTLIMRCALAHETTPSSNILRDSYSH